MIPPKKVRYFIKVNRRTPLFIRRAEGVNVLVTDQNQGDLFLESEVENARKLVPQRSRPKQKEIEMVPADLSQYHRWVASMGGRGKSSALSETARKNVARKAALFRHARNRAIKDAQ